MATSKTRKRPNVLFTGTPGTGKSTIASKVAENLNLEFIDIAKLIEENEFHCGFDEDLQSHILDEDKLLDHLEECFNSDDGGLIVDYHSCELFPKRWFDFVFVLRCDNTTLFDRLSARGYSQKKIKENIECEIFGTIAEEALEAYDDEIVHEMSNGTHAEMDENIRKITDLVSRWKR